MAVGELLLSAFFRVLFDRLASRDLLNFVCQLQGGVDFKLKKWENTLLMILAVLKDAEEKQLRNEAVKIWLDNLRDLAYDAEDILDEFATDALEQKLMAESDQLSSITAKNIVPAVFYNCFYPSTIKFNASMQSKIEDITTRLEELCKQKNDLGLQLTPGGSSSSTDALQRAPSSSVATERDVVGRDEDKAKILEMVLSDAPNDANIRVIPIIGMAGVGKTALAREVYNDRAVQDFKFDVKAWVCVSNNFNVFSISRSLLESITYKPCDLKALNEVQVELRNAADGKRVLIVLDDVWSEDYNSLENLKAPFLAAAPNSKIIVTTRHSNVASIMGSIEHYNLKCLSDEDCFSLFLKHAFEGRDIDAQQISEIHDKVVAKCRGLPLAAKTLGGLLRSKGDDAWDGLLNNNILDFPQQNGILPVLSLSYHYLPSHLKRCFAYCAIFPKDYEFTKKELVLLWMAEGIIQQSRNDKQPEDWGSECFDDLVSRSIFQQSNGDSSKFMIHDLVHDLAQLVSKETIFRLEGANMLSRRFERIRHSSYTRDWFDAKNKLEIFYKVEHLRTFLPMLTRRGPDTSYIAYMVISDLLPKLTKLRVLSLQGYHIIQLPDSIQDLRLLRYLNLAGTMIRSLPESTSTLFNLQILILRDCSQLTKLPSKMKNLINLRHLDIQGANSLKEMPPGIKQLKNLQTLSNFILGKGGQASSLKDLKNINFLHGELCIAGLENLNDSQDAREAVLRKKQNLEALSLQWGSQFDSSRNEVTEEINILDLLQPHRKIKRLTISYYGGARFPVWIGDRLFSKMEVLTLENCGNCKSLPSLGLLGSLKHLTIKGLRKLESINSEFLGNGCSKLFQSLETLRFENLPELKYWDSNIKENEQVEVFFCLLELSIVECPKLSGKIPEVLPSLEKLAVSNCAQLLVPASSFPMLCKLKIDKCKGMVCSSTTLDSKSVKFVSISNSAIEIYGCKGMLYNSPTELLKSVTISNILEFGKLLKNGFQIADTFTIGSSHRINSWKQFGDFEFMKQMQGLHMVTFSYPKEVSIEENCLSLISVPEVNFLPNNLRSLFIENIGDLKSLPEEMMGNSSKLERLHVRYCNSLTFIAKQKLPSSLKRLEIISCQNLQCLVDDEVDASSSSSSLLVTLQHLKISDCRKLKTLSSGIQCLVALEHLDISDCSNLGSLPDGLHNLNCLQTIHLSECAIDCFPKRGLPSNISSFSIAKCLNLKALPDDMHKLNSLQYLSIVHCPQIASFPKEGFPTSLTSLVVAEIEIYEGLVQWGLHMLTSLTYLYIFGRGINAESFPDEEKGMMLPTSLTCLTIKEFENLKYLPSMGFQSLVSLESLEISDCPKVKSFPELGLPSSLLQLGIYGCPLLQEKCKRDKGKEWSKIAHIPFVNVD